MSELCGAWAEDGRDISSRLTEGQRRAMRLSLGGGAEVAERLCGPLWLIAPAARLSERGGELAAWTGFIADDAHAPRPDGHYALVRARPEAGRLDFLRDPSGDERLYFARVGGLLLFSTLARVLLALPRLGARLNAEILPEWIVSDRVLFADATPFESLRELLAGHVFSCAPGPGAQCWSWDEALETPRGRSEELVREFGLRLRRAVGAALRGARAAAVSLSGGIDSSAIAALAVEQLGPDSVEAFTYDFDDPAHESEVPLAREVCRRLGIRRHHVVRIGFEEHYAALPEALWSTEDFTQFRQPYMTLLSRRIAERGFDFYLSGHGFGSHLGYLEELGALTRWLPSARPLAAYWRWRRAYLRGLMPRPAMPHPGLEAPFHRLYHLLLAVLNRRGLLPRPERYYPDELAALMRRAFASGRIDEALRPFAGLTTAALLQRLSVANFNSTVDVSRTGLCARRAGAARVSPAYFPSCFPYTNLPPSPAPPLWDPQRRERPGKGYLRRLMSGVLPDAVLRRRKNWTQAGGPARWRQESVRRMQPALGVSLEVLRGALGPSFDFLARQYAESLFPIALWHRLCIERPRGAPASWSELS